MNNLSIDSGKLPENTEVSTTKQPKVAPDLTPQKEKLQDLYNDFEAIHKAFPRCETYNVLTYLADLKRELKKLD